MAAAATVIPALNRSLQLVESGDKHNRIQAITNVMNTMIESCPSMTPPAQSNVPANVRNQATGSLNNIVKMMLRKGLVNDLARVTHSLDLSSPHMAMTVNSVLKPLETLVDASRARGASDPASPDVSPTTLQTSLSLPSSVCVDQRVSGCEGEHLDSLELTSCSCVRPLILQIKHLECLKSIIFKISNLKTLA